MYYAPVSSRLSLSRLSVAAEGIPASEKRYECIRYRREPHAGYEDLLSPVSPSVRRTSQLLRNPKVCIATNIARRRGHA